MNGHIVLKDLGKSYRRYRVPSDRLLEWMSFGHVKRHEEHWAVRNVTLEVAAGDAVGIVGANGAGKSTLLKLITGTTRPTTGEVFVAGRVAALLELGIGFHPDITGRENALMAGQLLGYQASDIAARMREIEDFAEIGSYVDLPIRTYSSGMHVRLAFSVATAIRPDVLIVDEALAVGDAYFQHKSFARIREFKRQGTTLLFVSHSAPIVKSICDRAILMESGVVVRDGEPDRVLDYYSALVASRTLRYDIGDATRTGTRSGDKRASIVAISLVCGHSHSSPPTSGEPLTIKVRLKALARLADLTVGFVIRDALGNDIFGTNTYHLQRRKFDVKEGAEVECDFHIRRLALGAGHYSLSVALHSDMTHVSGNYDWWDQAVTFEVIPGNAIHSIGVAALDVACEVVAPTERVVQQA